MAKSGVSRRSVARIIAGKIAAQPEKRAEWLKLGAAYLVERGQANRAEQLVKDIARELQIESGLLLASVTSARALDETTLEKLAAYLRAHTGAKDVSFDVTIDPSILSGVIVTTPDHELNVSGRAYLRRLASLEV
jgi:F0F1-type ATP synthase delta subunit